MTTQNKGRICSLIESDVSIIFNLAHNIPQDQTLVNMTCHLQRLESLILVYSVHQIKLDFKATNHCLHLYFDD